MVQLSEWIAQQKELLMLEKGSEIELLQSRFNEYSAQECQEFGISLLNLYIQETRTTLFGRCCYVLGRYSKDALLATHSFRVGDEISFHSQRESDGDKVDGIVTKVTSATIECLCDVDNNNISEPIRLNMRPNETTHNKMMAALENMLSVANHDSDCCGSGATTLLQIMFEFYDSPPEQMRKLLGVNQQRNLPHLDEYGEAVENRRSVFKNDLNPSQLDAIKHAMESSTLALIHGPPGTGKTSTVSELVVQAVRNQREKVLVACPSNVAVDNVLERIYTQYPEGVRPSMVRLGHPARISDAIQPHCLEALIQKADGTDIVKDVRKELDTMRRNLGKERDKAQKKLQRAEMRNLQKEIRQREERVVKDIVKTKDVIFCTCVGASSKLLRDIEFDLVIIDEAAQALEVACWIPMLKAKKVVLAGDHCQLPPTVKSDAAVQKGLAITLFERIMTNDSMNSVPRMLSIQYRMNEKICNWASNAMYKGLLTSSPGVASHTLADLVPPGSIEYSNSSDSVSLSNVMVLIDSSDCYMTEQTTSKGSHFNLYEVDMIDKYIAQLVGSGISPKAIGIVTPYNGQVVALKEKILPNYPLVEVRTVDGFQGGEKEVIILSLVRSNADRTVGFLADKRRINVAVTRAKRLLVVVCDGDTCSADPFLRKLLDYMSENGEHRSALEFCEEKKHDSRNEANNNSTAALNTAIAKLQNDAKIASSVSKSTVQKKPVQKKIMSTPSDDMAVSLSPAIAPRVLLEDMLDTLVTQYHHACVVSPNHEMDLSDNPFHASDDAGVSSTYQVSLLLEHPSVDIKHEGLIFDSVVCMNDRSYRLCVKKTSSSTSSRLVFPVELTSFHRRILHGLAEKYGLKHRSTLVSSSTRNRGGKVVSKDIKFMELSHEEFADVKNNSCSNSQTPANVSDAAVKCAENCIPENKTNNPVASSDKFIRREQSKSVLIHEGIVDSKEDVRAVNGGKIGGSKATAIASKHKDDTNTRLRLDNSRFLDRLEASMKPPQGAVAPLAAEGLSCSAEANGTKKASKSKSNAKTKDEPIDEDDFLDALIQENQEHANAMKYRVSCVTMPNPTKEKNKAQLKQKLNEAQNSRLGATTGGTGSMGGSKKKVVKKPPTNFGGGKIGTIGSL